ncbi:MAG: acyl-CoA dehydrogenase family protein [Candidatus Dormibacteraceae bacterium]
MNVSAGDEQMGTSTEALLRSARRVSTEIAGRAELHDREGSFAPENMAAIWSAGLGNLTVPAAMGGAGCDLVTTLRVIETIARGDASSGLILCMHLNHLGLMCAVDSPWPQGLRDLVLAESLARPALVNSAVVEPDLGSPSRGGVPATTARATTGAGGDRCWSISGHKTYITGSLGLRWMVVRAATSESDTEGQRTGSFLVRADTPGIEIRPTWDHLGMRASASHDVIFDGVEIPVERAIGLQSAARPPDRLGRDRSVLMQLSVYTGVAKAARDWLVGYLNQRVPSNLGAPLASLPRFQTAVGQIQSLIYANDQLLFGLAPRLGDSAGPLDAAKTKYLVTANVIAIAETAIALIGNPGLSYRHPLQRHFRDALCSRIHSPQDDVILLEAGRAGMEVPDQEA